MQSPLPRLWVLVHGGVGDWDEYALLLLAPLVIAAVIWITRRGADDQDENEDE
jgi:hypothetical protein